jgi:MYXO-CTERM domain-containing protein
LQKSCAAGGGGTLRAFLRGMKTTHLVPMVPVLMSLLAVASTALADGEACGKFDFSAGLDCEVQVKGGCETKCTPLQFEAACSGSCNASVTTMCAVDCETECMTKCNPGAINCEASCDGVCQSRCNSECSLSDCGAQCDATCGSECDASCTGEAPSCAVSCEQSCQGACTAQANINCDVDCYAQLEGGCMTQCSEPSGALFCNGQYVSAGDVDACIAYIRDALNGEVNVEARGEVTCDINGCESSGSTNGTACSTGPTGRAAGSIGALAALGLAAGALVRRRRRSM